MIDFTMALSLKERSIQIAPLLQEYDEYERQSQKVSTCLVRPLH